MSLPPLPKPTFTLPLKAMTLDGVHVWASDAFEEWGRLVRAQAIEECATACDKRARRNYTWGSENSDRYHAQAEWAAQCAADIRRLK